MTDVTAGYMTAPTMNGDKPLPRRLGARTMVPSTWVDRELKVSYTDADGKGKETSGILLDWCPVGLLIRIAGAKTLLTWERIVLVELQED